MDIKIEGRRHIGVTEYDAYRLIVAAALDTSGGKSMAQAVEHDGRNLQSAQHSGECLAVGAWLFRGRA